MNQKLRKSPINYFSDLFVVCMVILWIITALIMIFFAAYSTIMLCDNSIWCEVANLVAVPLSCGAAVYLVKCSVQHAIANAHGKECKEDFPRVLDEEFEKEKAEFGNDEGNGTAEDEAVG